MASVNLNALTEVQTAASTDNLLLFNETSNVATRIDYDKLASAILDKLTSKTYSGINNNVISAIAALTALTQGRQYGSIDAMYSELISLLTVNQTINCTATGNLVASLTNSEITKVCRVSVTKADTSVLDYMLFAPGSNAIYIGRINSTSSITNRNRFALTSDVTTNTTNLTTLTNRIVMTTLSTTQVYANETASAYNSLDIPGLSDYMVVLVNVNCANLRQTLVFVNGDGDQQYLYEIGSTNKIRAGFYIDWENNRVRVRYLSAEGAYTYQNVYFTKVVGFIKQ